MIVYGQVQRPGTFPYSDPMTISQAISLAGGFMTSGVLNAEYYRHYGADPRTFFLLPWAVDNERFATEGRLETGEREAMRARYDAAVAEYQKAALNGYREVANTLVTIQKLALIRVEREAGVVALQDALNKAWHVQPDPAQGGLKSFLTKRVMSFGMIMGVVFLMIASLVVSAVLAVLGTALALDRFITRNRARAAR